MMTLLQKAQEYVPEITGEQFDAKNGLHTMLVMAYLTGADTNQAGRAYNPTQSVKLRVHENPTESFDEVIKAVANVAMMRKESLFDNTREWNITIPRHVAMFIMNKHYKLTTVFIAKSFNYKDQPLDHTTILNAINRVEKKLEKRDSRHSAIYYKAVEVLKLN